MKKIYSLSRWFCVAGTLILVLMTLITVADVFLRYFFNSPITGVTDITEFMIVIAVFPALAWCALERSHVSVDILVSHFPKIVQAVIDTITLTATFIMFVIITWQSFLECINTTELRSTLLDIPFYPFQFIMSTGFALFCLSMLVIIIENMGKIIKEVKK